MMTSRLVVTYRRTAGGESCETSCEASRANPNHSFQHLQNSPDQLNSKIGPSLTQPSNQHLAVAHQRHQAAGFCHDGIRRLSFWVTSNSPPVQRCGDSESQSMEKSRRDGRLDRTGHTLTLSVSVPPQGSEFRVDNERCFGDRALAR